MARKPPNATESAGPQALPELVDRILGRLVETLPLSLAILDHEHRYLFVNEQFEAHLGRPWREIVGRDLLADYTEESRGLVRSALLIASVAGGFRGPLPPAGPAPATRSTDATIYRVVDPVPDAGEDSAVRFVLLVEDVSERRAAEEEHQRFHERFQLALRCTSDGLWDWEPLAGRVYFSPQWKAILGCAEDEFPDAIDAWWDRIHPDDREASLRRFEELRASENFPVTWEHRLRHQDGGYRTIAARGVSLRDGRGEVYRLAGSITDVTPQREAEGEARRRQAELERVLRLTTVGEMATGLAHEINQPLTAIAAYAESSARRLRQQTPPPSGALLDAFEEIAAQAHRAAEIVRRIRSFLRREPMRREQVDLMTLIDGVGRLSARDLLRNGIQLRVAAASPLPTVLADPVQLEQVLLNLVRNAAEAIEGNPPGRPRLIEILAEAGADRIAVVVSDTGLGVDPAAAERAFDPFFTTKREGLGMGLAISRSIVESHGGRIGHGPSPSGGAAFRVQLPLGPSLD